MAIKFFAINGTGGGGGVSAVNTDSGISGNGTIATPVILGGNPLTSNTLIQAGVHNFAIQGNNDIDFIINSGVNLKSLSIDIGQPGLLITDTIGGVGLRGAAVYSITDPKDYLQAGNQSNTQVAFFDSPGLTVTTTIPLYNLPASNQFLEILVYCNIYVAGAGNININVTFTNKHGHASSFNVGTLAGIGSMIMVPAIINAAGLSPVAVSIVVSSPGFQFDVGAVANLQFNN